MKKLILSAFTLLSLSAVAQEDKEVIIEKRIDAEKPSNKKTQEIVIRSKGDNNKKVTVEINGDKITINGKPIAEFKDEDITINKRNITIFDGKQRIPFGMNDMEIFLDGPMKGKFESSSSKAFLGVTTIAISENKSDTKSEGVTITDVAENSPGEKAGLKKDDIILKIDDTKVNLPGELRSAISAKKPKDEVTVTYKRDGKVNTTKATLGERKGGPVTAYSFSGPNGMTRSFSMPRLDLQEREFNKGMDGLEQLKGLKDLEMMGNGQMDNFNFNFSSRPKIGLKIQDVEEGSGVKVLSTDEDSPAEKAGLKKDDIITEINGKAVNNTDEARELLKPAEGKNNYTIKAKRNGTAMSFDVKIPKKLKTANL